MSQNRGEYFGKYIYILLVYLGLATTGQGLYNVKYMSAYYIGIAVLLWCVFLKASRTEFKLIVNTDLLRYAKMLFVPSVVIFIFSVIINILNPCGFSRYYSRAFGLAMYVLLAVLEAYFVFSYFGKKAIRYTFFAVALSYLTSCVVAFRQDGFYQFKKMIFDTGYNGSVLEMHEVAPIASLFAIYFLFSTKLKKENRRNFLLKEFICIFIIICSAKRINFLCCVIMIFVYEFIKRKSYSRKYLRRICKIIAVAFIIAALLYVFIVKSGVLNVILSLLNVNTMARMELWNGIRPTYEFSPLFLGRGSGFVSKWMDNNWSSLGIVGLHSSTGIHSDILKYYIELGFFGFIAYFSYYLYYIPSRIYKDREDNSFILCFVLFLLQFLVWFTDNISTYHNYLWILYLLFFATVYTSSKKGGRN